MSKGLFDKWRATSKGRRDERSLSAVPTVTSPSDPGLGLDPAGFESVDESLLLLSRELAGLAELPVSVAARERGWAALQRELERHPVWVAGKSTQGAKGLGLPAAKVAGGAARTARPRNLRWALASAAGVVAVVAALLGSYSGGLLQTADSGGSQGAVAPVASSDTTGPDTTFVTTPSTEGPVTTGSVESGPITTEGAPAVTTDTQPGITDGPAPTGGTQPSAPVTTQPKTPVTTSGSSGPAGSTTTRPAQATTGEQQMAAAQREGSAKALAVYLADLVITGNTSGARALVSSEAQSSLGYMTTSLNDPNGYKVTGARMLNDETVRVTLDIKDRVVNNAGEWVEVIKSFVVRVRVDDAGATIVAINAGS